MDAHDHIVEIDDMTADALRVGPADLVTAHALELDVHDDDVGDLLIALLGWDVAVVELASSRHARAGAVMLSCVSWLLLG